MRKKYYIVTANSSEPEISHPKNNPNTLIFAKARCRWDYAIVEFAKQADIFLDM